MFVKNFKAHNYETSERRTARMFKYFFVNHWHFYGDANHLLLKKADRRVSFTLVYSSNECNSFIFKSANENHLRPLKQLLAPCKSSSLYFTSIHELRKNRKARIRASQLLAPTEQGTAHIRDPRKIIAEIMPPRRALKRTAVDPTKADKPPKQIKQKQEIGVKPNLRSLSTNGVMLVFGQGDFGQLGLGEDVTEKMRPAAISEYQDVIAIAAGAMHNVCLRKTGEVMTFGCNDEGALGRDTTKEGSETVPGTVELPGKAIQVTAGDSHTAALLEDGRVFAWGTFRDTHGSMGLTVKGNERFPIEILPNVKVVKIASGNDHLVLLSENGRIYTCGRGEQGQLGRVAARTASRNSRQGIGLLLTPGIVEFKISKKLQFDDIWAGHFCTFAKENQKGDIYVFGLNNFHQIGLKNSDINFHPQISKTFNGKVWRHISSGEHHTIALDDAGQVFVMGRKEYGRLGLGPNCADAEELTLVPTLSSAKCIDVGAGSRESFAVTESGELYSWGMGTNGNLGTGDVKDVDEPVLVKGKQLEGKTVVRVSGGGQHTLALATTRPVKDKTAG